MTKDDDNRNNENALRTSSSQPDQKIQALVRWLARRAAEHDFLVQELARAPQQDEGIVP